MKSLVIVIVLLSSVFIGVGVVSAAGPGPLQVSDLPVVNIMPDALIALSGVVLSFFMAYFPGLDTWFDKMDPRFKPLFMAGVLLVVSIGNLLIGCSADWACIQVNWLSALTTWVTAMVLNQNAYKYGVEQFKRTDLPGQG